ncbi:MAG: sensor histidine kinase N-terminal domain-containing protein [Burkholderiaceae bacterium]
MSKTPTSDRPTDAPRTASLQRRLITAVLSLWVLAWAATGVLTWVDARHEVSELQDAHLAQAAALLMLQPLNELDERGQQTAADLHKYQPRVAFQVWHEGQLVARSANAPTVPRPRQMRAGFWTARCRARIGGYLPRIRPTATYRWWWASWSGSAATWCWPACAACSRPWH